MAGTAILIGLAVALRIGGRILDGKICSVFGLARSAIYLFLIIAWAVLLARRIIQKQLRLYLLGIAGSMLLWFGLRTIKYFFVPFGADPALNRMLWYAYYIPMLTIPVQSLFAALALRKPEYYQPSGWIQFAWLVTAGLVLLVLTNDFHQLVFSFSQPYPAWSDTGYSYEKLYWAVIGWMTGCSVIALGIMICKCSIPQKKTFLWLPMIPMALMGIYGSLCVVMWELVKPFAGDITAVYCVLIGMTFESCIQPEQFIKTGKWPETPLKNVFPVILLFTKQVSVNCSSFLYNVIRTNNQERILSNDTHPEQQYGRFYS